MPSTNTVSDDDDVIYDLTSEALARSESRSDRLRDRPESRADGFRDRPESRADRHRDRPESRAERLRDRSGARSAPLERPESRTVAVQTTLVKKSCKKSHKHPKLARQSSVDDILMNPNLSPNKMNPDRSPNKIEPRMLTIETIWTGGAGNGVLADYMDPRVDITAHETKPLLL